MNDTIYFDNSAATRVDERVFEAMKPFFFNTYAVATSEFGYSLGLDAREALENARQRIAGTLKAKENEFIFTSGSTESSNTALKGVAKALLKKKGNHIIISKIEDFPVLYSARSLEKEGFETTYLDVNSNGEIDLSQLKNSIRENTILVSVQHANQEIGTVQDIKAIGEICKSGDVLFHTDATHTYRRIPIDVSDINVDLITISSHTIHGPRGVGGLFIKEGTETGKWMDGGFQEFDRRAGVENIAGAAGFAMAAELITAEENRNIESMRNHLIDRITTEIPDTVLNGLKDKRTPQNANISFHYIEGESVTLHLDMRGFAVSTGSACFSRSLEASHVIMGIGGDHERAHGSIRFSLSRYNTMNEVNLLVDAIKEVVTNLRKISPLGKK